MNTMRNESTIFIFVSIFMFSFCGRSPADNSDKNDSYTTDDIRKYSALCESGNVDGCFQLGFSAEAKAQKENRPNGDGRSAFLKACKMSSDLSPNGPLACIQYVNLEHLVSAANNSKPHYVELLPLLKRACDLENARGCYFYGLMLYRVTSNFKDAAKYVEQGCKMQKPHYESCPNGGRKGIKSIEEMFYSQEIAIVRDGSQPTDRNESQKSN